MSNTEVTSMFPRHKPTICDCPCHYPTKNMAMLHFMPCCVTCKECEYRIVNEYWEEHQRFHSPYEDPGPNPDHARIQKELEIKNVAICEYSTKDIQLILAGSNDITVDAESSLVVESAYYCEAVHMSDEGLKAF